MRAPALGVPSGPPPRPAQPLRLRSGPLDLLFDNGDLRYVRLGSREVIRRIYGAVRDRNWATIPATLSGIQYEVHGDRFAIRYTSRHRRGEIDFVWKAVISGAPDGTVRFQFTGSALRTFLHNRIGLCVLLPIRECAGARCEPRYVNGAASPQRFPRWIATDQPVAGFHELAGISQEIAPGVRAELCFEGGHFEMEDQRNWIDASFKFYGTPLRLPRPVEIKAGARIEQAVECRIVRMKTPRGAATNRLRAAPARWDDESEAVEVRLAKGRRRLPAIGFGSSSQGGLVDERSLRRVRALWPAHLRVDLGLEDSPGWRHLDEHCSLARALGARVELAMHLDSQAGDRAIKSFLRALARKLRCAMTPLARVLVFGLGASHTSSREGLALARACLGGLGAPLGAGSNADLYELNRATGLAEADVVCWGMNPQVHAFDNPSLAETPDAAVQQVGSVRHRFPRVPVAVSPVTLRPRFNATATGPAEPAPRGELPAHVDARQASLFGAAWTLAMVKALAESGADSVTFYETTGWGGLLEPLGGPGLPKEFLSVAGAVFPLYHVFADVAEFAGGTVRRTESSRPLAVGSLLLERGDRRRLVLANLSSEPRRIVLSGLRGRARSRRIEAANRLQAMIAPEEFRAGSAPLAGPEIELGPHALATFDFSTR